MNEREALEQGLAVIHMSYPQAVDKLVQFSQLLLEKNKVMNLTAVTDPMEVVTRHFLDCASAGALLDLAGKNLVDVGCGAGFPGMPRALMYPALQVTLLDSLGKRIRFLQECIEAIGVPNAAAVHARAEEFAKEHREQFDLATSRAVARMNVLAELSLPLVRVGGLFAAMKSTNCDEELREAVRGISLLGGEVEAVHDYPIPLTDTTQRLVMIRKVRPTPGKYPRPFGRISAAPL
ncbi:MAG: 16S rRNA (guanine(527)-N(7))-methyltransferase RsmG [Intestinibacillus sp.]